MKLFTILFISFAAATAHAADTADIQDLASKAQVSDSCARKIMAATTRQCNAESKAREHGNREHECFYNYDMSGMENHVMNVGFTVGDADEWNYSVYVTEESDADSCDFTVKANN